MSDIQNEVWSEIKITVDTNDIEVAENIANMVVPYGIYIEDYSDLENEVMEIAHIDLIEEKLWKQTVQKELSMYMLTRTKTHLKQYHLLRKDLKIST